MKLVAAFAVLLAAAPASAESSTIELAPTCVEIDTSLDQLLEFERANARILLVRALERAEQLVVETGCTETVTLSHVRDNDRVIVRIKNSHAKRKLTVGLKEEMSEVYDRMVASLLEPVLDEPAVEIEAPPLSTEELRRPVTTPHTIPDFDSGPTDDDESKRSHGGHWYAMLALASQVGGGGAVIGGYRRNYGGVALDASLAFASTSKDESAGATSFALRGRFLRITNAGGSTSFFYGAGLGLAGIDRTDANAMPQSVYGSGGGLQVELAAGWELMRDSAHRWYLETSYSKPLFDTGDSEAPSAFTAGVGIGF